MKKIGFIDYYLDESHANNYPKMIKEKSGGRFQVCYAYGKIDAPNGRLTNKQWAEKHKIELFDTIEEVIEKSDFIIVLSPDNPEMHEELTDLPLKSGKIVYVDKTFAPDKDTAVRIFDNAIAHGTKCFSSSALRFASELKNIDANRLYRIVCEGPGNFETYSIHLIEPIVKMMSGTAKRVMFLGDNEHPSMLIQFEDGRTAQMYQRTDKDYSFRITAIYEDNSAEQFLVESDYFGLFIDNMVEFFETGCSPVSTEETINIISVFDAGKKAIATPFKWVEVQK